MKKEESPSSRPGEGVFAVVLLLLGAAAFAASLELWLRMPQPRAASAGATPLYASGVWVLMALWNAIETISRRGGAPLRFALPGSVLVTLALIAAYCALLFFGVSFYLATPLFLYGSMCALTRKDYAKNLVWTAVVMAAVVLVFRVLFGVVFP